MERSDQISIRLSSQTLIIILWCVVSIANVTLSLIGPIGWSETLKVLGTTIFGLILSLGLSYAIQRIIENKVRFVWPLLCVLILLGGSALWVIDTTLQAQNFVLGIFQLPTSNKFMDLRFNLVYYNLLFCLQAAALALLTFHRVVQVRERQLIEARLAAQQARLAALRFQLNPHFLFNTLNAISTLVAEAGVRDAEEMIERLADFLRTALSSDPADFITCESELETIQTYLDIEFVRFADRLSVHYACDPEVRDALVPGLLLQPLIENAIKHAVAPSKEMVTITLEACAKEGELVFVVENDGLSEHCRSVQPGLGLGLKNVADRIEVLYGSRASMEAVHRERSFIVFLRIPLQFLPPATGVK